jgi:hypothetical protein
VEQPFGPGLGFDAEAGAVSLLFRRHAGGSVTEVIVLTV